MAPFADFANFGDDGVLDGFFDEVKAKTCQRISSFRRQ
jgi:hypothetical protein